MMMSAAIRSVIMVCGGDAQGWFPSLPSTYRDAGNNQAKSSCLTKIYFRAFSFFSLLFNKSFPIYYVTHSFYII